MDENYILNEKFPTSEMSDQHAAAIITEKNVDVSDIGTFVMGEQNSSLITFQIARYYDGVDLSEKKIKIIYKNTNGIHESTDEEICNVKYSRDNLRFSWIISANATHASKNVAYICFLSDGCLLKTKSFTFVVESSFEPDETTVPAKNWFLAIEEKIATFENELENYVRKEHIDTVPTEDSKNLITSGAVYQYIQDILAGKEK